MAEKRKGSTKKLGRDYTYDKAYIDRPEQREANAARKRARRLLEAEGKVKPFDNRDVGHSDSDPTNNSRKNLKVESKSANRGKTKNGKRV
jgi:hypothetical protein